MVRRLLVLAVAATFLAVPSATAQVAGDETAGPSAAKPIAGTHCSEFPADNWWHADVSGLPVDSHSDQWLSHMSTDVDLHPDFGPSFGDGPNYGIPITVVGSSHPEVKVRFDYADESDKGPVPIPRKAHIEGWRKSRPNPPGGDRHVVVVRRGSCDLTELYKAKRMKNKAGDFTGWRASSAARWDLSSNALRPKYWTSADAAGLPILPGLLDYDEAVTGTITHALRFTLPVARNAFTAPARHCGSTSGKNLPSYGMRFRLKAGFDESVYTGAAKAVVVAMKQYGLMFADQGSAMYVTGMTDPRWSAVLDQFRAHPIDGSRFEVVDPGPITVCR